MVRLVNVGFAGAIGALAMLGSAQAAETKMSSRLKATKTTAKIAMLAAKPRQPNKLATTKNFASWQGYATGGKHLSPDSACNRHKSAWSRSGDWRSIVDYYTCRY